MHGMGGATNHLFVVDGSVFLSISEEESAATVAGMKEMDLYHLPYENDLITLRLVMSPGFYFEVKGLRDDQEFIFDHVTVEHYKYYKTHGAPDYKFEVCKGTPKYEDLTSKLKKFPPQREGKNYLYRYRATPEYGKFATFRERFRDFLIVLLASKGLEKKTKHSKLHALGIGEKKDEYVTTIRLSKNLEQGTEKEAAPGHPVRPHLRRGHIRSQHYGIRNSLVKQIWIEPIFVNVDESFISARTAYRILN